MAPARKKPSLTVQLAAALCALTGKDGERLIPHEHAKAMSAKQVISLFHFDHHPIPHAEGGPAEHWNLDPQLIAPHREKTATIDTPGIAKRKRVAAKHGHHLAAMAAKVTGEAPAPARRRGRSIPNRPFAKGHRPLGSRNDLRRRKS